MENQFGVSNDTTPGPSQIYLLTGDSEKPKGLSQKKEFPLNPPNFAVETLLLNSGLV